MANENSLILLLLTPIFEPMPSNNRELTSFQTIKDLDTIIETLLINSSTDTHEAIKNVK